MNNGLGEGVTVVVGIDTYSLVSPVRQAIFCYLRKPKIGVTGMLRSIEVYSYNLRIRLSNTLYISFNVRRYVFAAGSWGFRLIEGHNKVLLPSGKVSGGNDHYNGRRLTVITCQGICRA